jgi:hypothetical protein
MAARHGDPREGGPETRLLVWSGNQDITACSETAVESRQISFDASSAASDRRRAALTCEAESCVVNLLKDCIVNHMLGTTFAYVAGG